MQVYSGVNKLGYIQPQTLARQDIVITSYETLRKEIDYVDLPHTNSQLLLFSPNACISTSYFSAHIFITFIMQLIQLFIRGSNSSVVWLFFTRSCLYFKSLTFLDCILVFFSFMAAVMSLYKSVGEVWLTRIEMFVVLQL